MTDGITLSLARERSGYIGTSAPASLKKGKIPIRMEEFTKTIYSFRFGPPDMHGGTKHLFDPSRDQGGYFQLFGDRESGEIHTKLTAEQFQIFVGTWFLCEYAKAGWKQAKSLTVITL